MTEKKYWSLTLFLILTFFALLGLAFYTDNPDLNTEKDMESNKQTVCNVSNQYINVENATEAYYNESRKVCLAPEKVNASE